jgi:hypothetical protein
MPDFDDTSDRPLVRKKPVFSFDDKAGGDFIRFMDENHVHPVLVFGTRLSGKSTMLLSALGYAMGSADAGINVRVGEDPFPATVEDAQSRYLDAKAFLNVKVPAFNHGDMPPATSTEHPFFIPLDIEIRGPGNTGRTCKLAFLEGQGEWFEMDTSTGVDFREMKPEVTAILKRFPNPISVIFVSPCRSPEGRVGLEYSHRCLANCVDQYRRHRNDPARDHLLLMMSKWDARHPPGTDGFNDPAADLLLKEVQDWRFIWNAFSTLNGIGSKSLLPYSAGMISGNFVNPPGVHKRVFDRYNRLLLNWIIGNATQPATGNAADRPPPLYPDAAPPTKGKPSALDRFIDFILGTK